MPLLLSELADQIGTVTLDHDAKRNALSRALIGELIDAFAGLERRQARAVILRAKPGARVWSAGHDINELPQPGRDPLHYLDPLEQLIRTIRSFPGAVIALIEGSVWGGACELALCCDLIVATPGSTFAITPARLGVPYNSSGVLRVMNAVGLMLAKEMFFTAEPIPAERVFRAGAIAQLAEPAEIEQRTRALARRVSEGSPLAIAVLKETLRLLGNAAPLHPETFERIQGLRRAVYDSADYREGIEAFQQKRKPVFRGE